VGRSPTPDLPAPWSPERYRAELPRLYGALLARHGGPNGLQLAAAPALQAGGDLLVQAPTASGKTEAVLVPLVERLVPPRAGEAARVLVVSPTRALVNDLARRLGEPLDRVGVGVGRWTGDHHDGGRLHPVTVLTPEGLDSRLARVPGQLDEVRALVLDELHVVDGGVRGDQLRLLVARLRNRHAAGGRSLQVVGASATVPDPGGMAGRYLQGGAVLSHGDRRRLRARLVEEGRDVVTIQQELTALLTRGFRKILAFVDTREGVESLAAALRGRPPFGHAVFAHHGSLARRVRLSVEERFRRSPVALCVATSTLEVGLDIGDVDLVALIGPPPDVPALLQRAGRGGRRGDSNTVVVFCAGHFEAEVARTLLRAQAAGRWLVDPPAFHPSVIVQQALSLAGRRRGGVDPGALLRRLPDTLQPQWPTARLAELLRSACDAGWLLRVGEGPRCVLGDKGEAAWRRGQVHGNLEGAPTVTVVDAMTGDAVGAVSERSAGGLSLAGRARRVLKDEGERVVAASGGGGGLPVFGASAALPTAAALAAALLEDLRIPVPCRVRLPGGETIFHGLGSGGGTLLGRVLRRGGIKLRRAGALAVVLRSAPFDDLPATEAALKWPRAELVARELDLGHAGLARTLGLGAYHGVLPEELQRHTVAVHVGAAAVEAFLRAGLPPRVPVTDEALWEAAAWR